MTHVLQIVRYLQEVRFLRELKWPGGQPPLSEPPCGFRGEKCVSKYLFNLSTDVDIFVFNFLKIGASYHDYFEPYLLRYFVLLIKVYQINDA